VMFVLNAQGPLSLNCSEVLSNPHPGWAIFWQCFSNQHLMCFTLTLWNQAVVIH